MLWIKERYTKELLQNKVDKEVLIEKHIHEALGGIGLDHNEDLVHETISKLLDIDMSGYSLIEGAMDALQRLKESGHKLTICSNTHIRSWTEKYFKQF